MNQPKPPELPSEAAQRAELIRRSLRVFVLGIIGALPGLGLIFGLTATVAAVSVRASYRDLWNPAERYLRAGGLLGLLGFLSSLGLIAVLAAMIAMRLVN
jgi:hypothetical protein